MGAALKVVISETCSIPYNNLIFVNILATDPYTVQQSACNDKFCLCMRYFNAHYAPWKPTPRMMPYLLWWYGELGHFDVSVKPAEWDFGGDGGKEIRCSRK